MNRVALRVTRVTRIQFVFIKDYRICKMTLRLVMPHIYRAEFAVGWIICNLSRRSRAVRLYVPSQPS